MGVAGIIGLVGSGLQLIGNIWSSAKAKKESGQTTGQAIQGTLAQYGANYSPYGFGMQNSGVGIVTTPSGIGVTTAIDFKSLALYGGLIALFVYLLKR